MKVKLGGQYKDKLHDVEGIAVARTEYLTGCNRVELEFCKDAEIKTHWLDETRLVFVADPTNAAQSVMMSGEKPGGPGDVAPSRDPVSR